MFVRMNPFSTSDLSLIEDARSRSISPENFTGEKGGGGRATEGTGSNSARDLGVGWKISPCVIIKPGQTFELADIEGPGSIRHPQDLLGRGGASLGGVSGG